MSTVMETFVNRKLRNGIYSVEDRPGCYQVVVEGLDIGDPILGSAAALARYRFYKRLAQKIPVEELSLHEPPQAHAVRRIQFADGVEGGCVQGTTNHRYTCKPQ